MKIKFRSQIPLFLKIAAILLAVIGQAILIKHLIPGIALLLAALGLFLFSMRKTVSTQVPALVVNPLPTEKLKQNALTTGGIAVALGIISFFLFSTKLPNLYAWILHILSLVLILVAAIRFTGSRKKRAGKADAWHWMEIAALIAVFVAAIFLRFYKISQLPFGLWYDDAENGLDALQLFADPDNLPVFATTLPAHFIYLIAFSIKLFGQTIFSIRLVSALFGIATVAAAFLAGREMFNRRIGILLAFFMAISRWDLIWSHLGMHGITVPFFELLTFGLVLRALRLQRYKDYLFAGLSLGLGLCFYVPFRIFPIVILLLAALAWITHPGLLKKTWRHLIIFMLGAFIVSVPISQFAVFHADEFWGRTSQVSVFKDRTLQEGLKTVLKTTGEHVAMFTYKGDRNGRHNIPAEPMLDTVTAALFILGAGICIYRIKNPLSIVLLFWLIFMLSPGILSLDFESPQSLRAIGSMPAAFLIAAVAVHALLEDKKSIFKKKNSAVVLAVMALVVASMGGLNYYNYFVREANSSEAWSAHSTPDTIIAREMNRYGDQVEYFVSTFYYDTPTIRYLAPTIKDYYRIETHETFPFLLDGQKDAVFFIDLDRKPVYEQLKQNYPQAVFTEHTAPNGNVALFEVYLTRADIQSIQGMDVKYYSTPEMEGGAFRISTINLLSMDWTVDNTGTLPFFADYTGTLYAHRYGVYQFRIESPAGLEFYIDGKLALQGEGGTTSGSVELAKGLHAIEIIAEGEYGTFEVNWQPPEEELTVIPAENLYLPTVAVNGLLGSYYANANWEGSPVLKQIDPFIHYYFHNPPLERPYTVEWLGRIKIDLAGTYELGTESIDAAQLYIDDNLILDNQTINQYQGVKIDLTEGFHKIKIRFSDLTSHTHVNLYWTPPDGERDTIPSEVLFLP